MEGLRLLAVVIRGPSVGEMQTISNHYHLKNFACGGGGVSGPANMHDKSFPWQDWQGDVVICQKVSLDHE